MWKSFTNLASSAIKPQATAFLKAESVLQEQIRTTFILKRRFPTQLHKKGAKPKTLRSRHYIYKLVEDTNIRKYPNIDLILTNYVEGFGNAGEKVSVKPHFAYNNLLLPGLAVYATPPNAEKYSELAKLNVTEVHSTQFAALTVKTMSRMLLSVVMNKENPWTIQPWHIKASFRKCGYAVPEETIKLPKQPISGPDMNLESKEFFVTVTINNLETVNVRCRLHHWSTEIQERIPHVRNFWDETTDAIFEEDKDVLEKMPPKVCKPKVRTYK